jgi:pimeloyl-ACP methyl ester carboxylesterase
MTCVMISSKTVWLPVCWSALALFLCMPGVSTHAAAVSTPPDRYVAVCDTSSDNWPDNPKSCAHVLKVGPKDARTVIVLIPGGSLGAGSLRSVARDISGMVPDTQVWAMERREQNLADVSKLGGDNRLDYYMKGQYRRETEQTAAYTRSWGLADAISDLRRIMIAARDGGHRRVFLGGHSWGATIALAYAAWDFQGEPGYRALAGLILVDGGVHDSWAGEGYKFRLTADDVAKKLKQIESGNPFTGDLGYIWQLNGPPEELPIYYQLAATYAQKDPHGASTLQTLLPKAMQPSTPLTNLALLGWLTDTHAPTADLQVHSGHIADSDASVHDWVSTGPAPIAEVAEAFAQTQAAAVEWYWPRRLTLDLEAIDPFVASPATRALNLPLVHAAEIDVPLYAFQTGLTHGTVNEAAKWVVENSRIRKTTFATDESMAHLDPLFDSPSKNKFLTTVEDFVQATQ